MLVEHTDQQPSGPRLARNRPAFDVGYYGVVMPSPLPLPDENGFASPPRRDFEPERSKYEERLEETLEAARTIMRANLARHDFGIEEVAREVAIGKRQLQRMFRDTRSPGFRAELTEVRMKEAARLLSLESNSVTEVSEEVGYRQPMHFAKAFRRRFKCSPREWRAQCRSRPDA